MKVILLKMPILFKTVLFIFFTSMSLNAASGSGDIKKMVFEEQRIEGKIRRPQLVLIKVEQRPEFKPMVLQSLGNSGNISSAVDRRILDDSPYKEPFRFDGMKINNYVP